MIQDLHYAERSAKQYLRQRQEVVYHLRTLLQAATKGLEQREGDGAERSRPSTRPSLQLVKQDEKEELE